MLRHGDSHHTSGFIFISILLTLLLIFVWQPAQAAPGAIFTITVDTLTDHVADYDKYACTAAPDDCSLRGAIRFANGTAAGSEIHITIPAGTYYLMRPNMGDIPEDLNVTGDLDIISRTVILHGAGTAQTILDGQTLDRLLDNQAGILTVENLKITQGVAPAANYGGGAIRNYNSSTLYVKNVVIQGNSVEGNGQSDHGGGISNLGTLVVAGATIMGNSACDGGGILSNNATMSIDDSYIAENTARTDVESCGQGGGLGTKPPNSQLQLTNSEVYGNNARRGGGVFFNGSSARIINNYFNSNVASSSGGGIEALGSLTISDTTLSSNDGGVVGGGLSINGTLLAHNITMYINHTSYGGGGLYGGADSILSIEHATFYGNYTASSGAALWISGSNSLTLHDNILASDDTGNTCNLSLIDTFNDPGYNLGSDHSCGLSIDRHDLIDTDPILAALAYNGGQTPTMALLTSSPAIDSGDPITCQTRDQRGYYRPVNGVSDIGAYERDSFPLTLFKWLPLILNAH
jgi:hypothetical protein